MRELSPDERERILALIRNNQKILAIKYIRHLFNYGLVEAQYHIEQLTHNPYYSALESEQSVPLQWAETHYKSIELDCHTQTLFLVSHQGTRSHIDTTHPGWQTLMLLFSLREFQNEQDYLSQIKLIRNAEDLSLLQQKHHKRQHKEKPQNDMLRLFYTQDKKNNVITAFATLFIVLCCAFFIFASYF